MEEFEHEIKYKKGCNNVVADELLRNVRMVEKEGRKETQSLEEVHKIIDEMIRNIADEDINKETAKDINVNESDEENLVDDIEDISENEHCPDKKRIEVFDLDERKRIIKKSHNGLLGGHKGQNATYANIKEKFQWKGMQRDVEQYVKNCEFCQYQKVTRKPTRNPMKIVSTAERAYLKKFVWI